MSKMQYYKTRTDQGIEILSSDEVEILDETGFKVKILRKATEKERKNLKK